MRRFPTCLPLACAAAVAAAPAAPRAADGPGGELALFALDDVLNAETAVASRRVRTVRESPGIVTIVTREEILDSGARDLQDILSRVAGFQFGTDVLGVVGVGFRGIWANEGKVLLLVDGFEMNELLYGTLQFGHELPIDQVKQIEVVRGPGSAMYGGFAEVAVVNVVTVDAADLGGARVSTEAGRMRGGPASGAASLAYGREAGGWSFSAKGALASASRSGATYADLAGGSFDMSNNAALGLDQVNVAAAHEGLELRFLHQDYRSDTRDGFDTISDRTQTQRFASTSASAQWKLHATDRLEIKPRLEWKRSTPWQIRDRADPLHYDKTANRIGAKVLVTWDPSAAIYVGTGVEAYADQARIADPADVTPDDFAGRRTVTYQNVGAFGEVGWDGPIGNFLAGARVERHSAFGGSFVPRLAYTKLLEPFHVKLLYSHAFRAPAIENLDTGVDVTPERTRSIEAEVGCRLSEALFATANVFDTTIDDVIVYGYDPATDLDVYANFAHTGSRGVEVEVRATRPWATATLGWSYQTAAGKNQVPLYAVPGSDDRLLGFATHKVTLATDFRIRKDLHFAPAAVWTSARPAFTSVDADGNLVLGQVGAAVQVDAFLLWRNALVRGLELGAGVHDLLDEGTPLPQPYAGGHAPLPGAGRELMVRVAWSQLP